MSQCKTEQHISPPPLTPPPPLLSPPAPLSSICQAGTSNPPRVFSSVRELRSHSLRFRDS